MIEHCKTGKMKNKTEKRSNGINEVQEFLKEYEEFEQVIDSLETQENEL